ncbi:hypothetical protein QTP86_017624, partial [Hemibagrus guttatus]
CVENAEKHFGIQEKRLVTTNFAHKMEKNTPQESTSRDDPTERHRRRHHEKCEQLDEEAQQAKRIKAQEEGEQHAKEQKPKEMKVHDPDEKAKEEDKGKQITKEQETKEQKVQDGELTLC